MILSLSGFLIPTIIDTSQVKDYHYEDVWPEDVIYRGYGGVSRVEAGGPPQELDQTHRRLSQRKVTYHPLRLAGLVGNRTSGRDLIDKYVEACPMPVLETDRSRQKGDNAPCSSGWEIMDTHLSDKPITMKPAETRMGSSKGSPEYWVSVIRPGRIIYELVEYRKK
ncbi:hypothetical protein L7F22_027634 [Adiantum nelumboides]|nr:hypothetical protein [Adiantum nelumboides]